MKYILLLLVFNSQAIAGNWVSPADIAKINLRQPGARIHMQKSTCGSNCQDITGRDLRREKVVDVVKDDPSKPNFRAPEMSPDLADCSDSSGCSQLAFICSEEGLAKRWDLKSNWPDIPGSTSLDDINPWFLWCEKILSYDSMTVREFVVDPAMVAAADANKAARNQLKTDLIAEDAALDTALDNWESLTQVQRMRAMKRVLRVLRRK